jgi:hypothetical protein
VGLGKHPSGSDDAWDGLQSCPNGHYAALGFSTTTYDLVRISSWALIVFGAVIVAFALVRELRQTPVVGE